MSKVEKSGFFNQGSIGWGILVGTAIGASYCLLRKPQLKESDSASRNSTKDSLKLENVPQEDAGGPAEAKSVIPGTAEFPDRVDTSRLSGERTTHWNAPINKDNKGPIPSGIKDSKRRDKDHKRLAKAGSIAGLLLMGGGLVGGGVALMAEVSGDNDREGVAVTREVNDVQIGTILKLYDHAIEEVEKLNDGLDDVNSRLDEINEKLDENLPVSNAGETIPTATSSIAMVRASELPQEQVREIVSGLDNENNGNQFTVTIGESPSNLDQEVGSLLDIVGGQENGASRWRVVTALTGGNPQQYNLVHPGERYTFSVTYEVVQTIINEDLPLVVNPPEAISQPSVELAQAPAALPGSGGAPAEEIEAPDGQDRSEEQGHKINICHRTGSNSHPVEAINVDRHAFDGEGNNDHTQHGDFPYAGPIDKNGHPTKEGNQWCEGKIATPTATATSVPTPESTATSTPQSTETPVATPTSVPTATSTPVPTEEPSPTPVTTETPTVTPSPTPTPEIPPKFLPPTGGIPELPADRFGSLWLGALMTAAGAAGLGAWKAMSIWERMRLPATRPSNDDETDEFGNRIFEKRKSDKKKSN